MNHLAEELEHYLTLDITLEAKTIVKIIKERVEGSIAVKTTPMQTEVNTIS